MNLENTNPIDKKFFWDNKIIGWEKKNYGGKVWGSAIRSRRNLCLTLAKDAIYGKVVFESGCGSAGHLEELFSLGAIKYIGCDLSSVAIEEAKTAAVRLGLTSKTEFLNRSALDTSEFFCDFHFSLGLWDWLDDDEIVAMMRKSRASSYLHSYSEFRLSPTQLLHRMYVYSAYGRKNMTYTPQYRSEEQIAKLMKLAKAPAPETFRHSDMSFSTFAYKF